MALSRLHITVRPGLADALKGAAQIQGRSTSEVCDELLSLALAAKGVAVSVPERADPWAVKV
jgi:hypothetical protein